MRRLEKKPCPQILVENEESWMASYLESPDSASARYRYRHPEIKATLKEETASKCIYCESKIGHNTPGDVEHKIPTSVDNTKHFKWDNLTIACAECNRRKSDYFNAIRPFLDPYVDDVESLVVHYGPIVGWLPGNQTAEISVRKLELHDGSRKDLLHRKIEKIADVNELLARIGDTAEPTLRAILLQRLEQHTATSAEYSAMVISICKAHQA